MLVTEHRHLRRLWRRITCRLSLQQLMTTPYSHLRLWLPLNPTRTRRAARCRCSTSMSSKPPAVSRWLRRVTFPTSVQCRVCKTVWVAIPNCWWFATYALKFITSITLDGHSYSHLNHDVSQQPNKNANDDITIGFIYSSAYSVPFAVPSYSYCVTSSIENYVKSLLTSRRRTRVIRRAARRRRRAQGRHRAPLSGIMPTLSAVRQRLSQSKCACRRWVSTPSTEFATPCAAFSIWATANSLSTARLSVLLESDSPTDINLYSYYCITLFSL